MTIEPVNEALSGPVTASAAVLAIVFFANRGDDETTHTSRLARWPVVRSATGTGRAGGTFCVG
ncbi:hypothetical protein ACFVKB_26755 [Rhodococcus sp. NPDC127530]|uniref:hypothetical protein n=1 Tax=unclassified Rhodococcus (in: high G+C Gram-positive bacteria) TaxID=192944 RepID=UPI00363FD850